MSGLLFIAAGVVVGVLVMFVVLVTKFGFWGLVAKFPDQAHEWFEREGCWVVLDDPLDPLPKPGCDYSGPYSHHVPRLGRTIRVYGLKDRIEDSQSRFRAHVGGI